jgi:hypothetical protein
MRNNGPVQQHQLRLAREGAALRSLILRLHSLLVILVNMPERS